MNTATKTSANVVSNQKPITIWMKKILGYDLTLAGTTDNQLLRDYRRPGENGNVLAEGAKNLLESYLQLCRAIQEFKKIMDSGKYLRKPVSELWQDRYARSLAKTIYALSDKNDFMFVQTEELVGDVVQTARNLAESVRYHWKQTTEVVNQDAGRILDEVERALEGKTGYKETPSALSAQINRAGRYGRYLSDALKERASNASEKIRQFQELLNLFCAFVLLIAQHPSKSF